MLQVTVLGRGMVVIALTDVISVTVAVVFRVEVAVAVLCMVPAMVAPRPSSACRTRTRRPQILTLEL